MLSCQHLDSRWDASQTWTLQCGLGSRPGPSPNLITPRSLGDLLMGPGNHKQ